MTDNINKKQNNNKGKHIIYPIDYVYIGKRIRTITKNGITVTYHHYDCFIGNDKTTRCCTKYKRVTGNYADNYFELEKPTCFLKDTKNNIEYELKPCSKVLSSLNGNIPIQYVKLHTYALSKKSLREQYLKNKMDYIYIGYYPRTITKNGITFTYDHYDCFIGNAKHITCCTKYKRITGNYAENYFKLEEPTTLLKDTKNDIKYNLRPCYRVFRSFNGNTPIQYVKLRTYALSKSSLREEYLKIKTKLTQQMKASKKASKTETLIDSEFESASLNAKK